MLNNILNILKIKIEQGDQNSPCLFLWNNIELINAQIKEKAQELLKEFDIPKSYLYIFENKEQTIKIKEIKDFIELSQTKSPYKFQIFLIENIWNMTNSAWNSLLKILEEPWNNNIFFLTATWENNILDTILSRVQIINLWTSNKLQENYFYLELIENYKKNKNDEILSYFFTNKLEKEEYIKFLENLVLYFKKNISEIDINYFWELDNDINWIKQNNLLARNVVDKWLMLM